MTSVLRLQRTDGSELTVVGDMDDAGALADPTAAYVPFSTEDLLRQGEPIPVRLEPARVWEGRGAGEGCIPCRLQ